MFEKLKWINREAAPLAALTLLLGAGAFFHRLALAQLNTAGWHWPGMNASAAARLHFVAYVDSHPWLVLMFAALFATCLLWLQVRKLPRWSLRLTFALLAVPVLCYLPVCLLVATAPSIWR